MDYRKVTLRTLGDFANENPDLTLGDIFYSVIRPNNSGAKELKDIRDMSDEDFYTAVERAREAEEKEVI